MVALFAAALLSTPAYADIIWPELLIAARIGSYLAVFSALLVEYIFVLSFFKTSLARSALITLCMNLASTVVGIGLVRLAVIIGWEAFPGILLYGEFDTGTWISVIPAYLFTSFLNAGIEFPVIVKGFKLKVGQKGFWILALANAVGIAATSLILSALPRRALRVIIGQ